MARPKKSHRPSFTMRTIKASWLTNRNQNWKMRPKLSSLPRTSLRLKSSPSPKKDLKCYIKIVSRPPKMSLESQRCFHTNISNIQIKIEDYTKKELPAPSMKTLFCSMSAMENPKAKVKLHQTKVSR